MPDLIEVRNDGDSRMWTKEDMKLAVAVLDRFGNDCDLAIALIIFTYETREVLGFPAVKDAE